MSVLTEIEQEIRDRLAQAAEDARDAGEVVFETLPDFVLEKPREKKHGDYATNLAMQLARPARKNPREIAGILAARFQREPARVESLEVAGAGFLNITLSPSWQQAVVPEVLREGPRYGESRWGEGRRVQVEFVSANPTGIPHMGNARGAALGDAIATLLEKTGHRVEREYYVNDAGNQIEKFGWSLEARYLQERGQDAEMPGDGYHGEDLRDTVQHYIADGGEDLLAADPARRRGVLVSYALKEKLGVIRDDLARFGVRYDRWFYESSLYESGAVDNTLEKLRERGYLYEKDGALWLAATRFGEDKDEVMVRSGGTPTYYAADIAYHLDKYQRGFGTLINVWGADHHGHVSRMKGAMQALGYDPDSLEVVLMQLVRLFSGGEVVRMSKRTGRYISLGELMDDVGVDAARYFFVMRSPDSHLDFDLDLAREESNENPVFYVQYAHARICSILRQGGVEPGPEADYGLLTEEAERELLDKVAQFPGLVSQAARLREPHRLCAYAHELAGLFHVFYTRHRVLQVEPALMQARLGLAAAVQVTLKNVLEMIGVSAPERM